eukprot:scaffold409_cov143-Skeletonema_menzelii.AAC.15
MKPAYFTLRSGKLLSLSLPAGARCVRWFVACWWISIRDSRESCSAKVTDKVTDNFLASRTSLVRDARKTFTREDDGHIQSRTKSRTTFSRHGQSLVRDARKPFSREDDGHGRHRISISRD